MKRYLKPIAFVIVGLLIGVGLTPSAVQAAVNYFNTTKVVGANGTAKCPSGWHMTGGGVKQLPTSWFSHLADNGITYTLTGSYPYGNGWRATAVETVYHSSIEMPYTYAYTPRVYAVCAN